MSRTWKRLTVEVDFGLEKAVFRCRERVIDSTPSIHVAADPKKRYKGLRAIQAIGDQNGFPHDAIHIYFFADSALPDDVRARKPDYFASWWRFILDLMCLDNVVRLNPRVRIFVHAELIAATNGLASEMIRKVCRSGGAHSVEIIEEGHGDFRARTG